MTRLTAALRELLGLFVDDGSLALAILAWIGIVALALPALGLPGNWRAVALFLGCALILAENVARSARRGKGRRQRV
jgi:membrane protein implicated in regulation of membrane protease activity